MSTTGAVYEQVHRVSEQLAQLSHELHAALGNSHRSVQEKLINTRMEMLQVCMAVAKMRIANFESEDDEEIDVVN